LWLDHDYRAGPHRRGRPPLYARVAVKTIRDVTSPLERLGLNLAGREAAKAAFDKEPPPDCLERRWAVAQRRLQHFVEKGYADLAALMGWTPEELYRVPPV